MWSLKRLLGLLRYSCRPSTRRPQVHAIFGFRCLWKILVLSKYLEMWILSSFILLFCLDFPCWQYFTCSSWVWCCMDLLRDLEKRLAGICQRLPKRDATSRCGQHYRIWTSMGVVGLKKLFFWELLRQKKIIKIMVKNGSRCTKKLKMVGSRQPNWFSNEIGHNPNLSKSNFLLGRHVLHGTATAGSGTYD
jgi:hypothetical protein